MPNNQSIESFKGGSWSECNTFIQSIRAAAWREGKLRDQEWTADFASLYFSDEALEWYSRLSLDIQGDWSKLQTALVERWSPNGTSKSSTQTITEPAPSSSSSKPKEVDYFSRGVIKTIRRHDNTPLYLQASWAGSGSCHFTDEREQALHLRFDSSSNPRVLESVGRQPHSWLAVHWTVANPDMGRSSTDYAYVTIVDSETLKSSDTWNGPYQLLKCRVSHSSEITIIWKNGNTETTLIPFEFGRSFYVAPDINSFRNTGNADWIKPVKLFLEAIDQ